MKFIKIYGLQKSGTNYCEWLFKNNFPNVWTLDEGNILGWKHNPPPKNIDWTASNWDNQPISDETRKRYLNKAMPYKEQLQAAFDNQEIITIIAIRNPYSWIYQKDNILDNIQTWNYKNKKFMEFLITYKNSKFVKHEDLISNPELVLNEIVNHFDLTMTNFVDQKNRINPRQSVSNEIFDKQFYIEKKYINWIKDKKININSLLDFELMNFYNFQKEEI